MTTVETRPVAQQATDCAPECALRPGEACRLCQPGATGPDDCPVAWLVRHDPELSAQLRAQLEARRCA
ncbi:DUF6767 domain-containing protein [Nocardioides sp. GY 10127]|uniref:DUF6767 domain-containing protein n=1 Tax=Nocardioides sp. GY 10127 TaxID=2569762 RepID=UPI0010A8E8BC|nr:DUF6767 domain-containing protein [Nocardioides sp. GY 10127]TIC80803.1 hypothetical protein E8D37_13160 [Nocardioides sp. GY 10127]